MLCKTQRKILTLTERSMEKGQEEHFWNGLRKTERESERLTRARIRMAKTLYEEIQKSTCFAHVVQTPSNIVQQPKRSVETL